MGYLSQKKSQNRKNLFFKVTSVVVIFLSLLLVYNPDLTFCKLNLFHLFLLSFLLLVLSLYARSFKTSAIFLLSFIICYTNLNSSCNIFLSDSFSGKDTINLTFSPNEPFLYPSSSTIEARGTLILAERHQAFYTTTKEPHPLTIIQVNFKSATQKEYPLLFRHLHQFIVSQNNPVIVYGEFGIPAWQKVFRTFLAKSGLSVKNSLVFTSDSKYNIFSTPSFYILGFSKMGVSNISLNDAKEDKNVSFDITFNPMLF